MIYSNPSSPLIHTRARARARACTHPALVSNNRSSTATHTHTRPAYLSQLLALNFVDVVGKLRLLFQTGCSVILSIHYFLQCIEGRRGQESHHQLSFTTCRDSFSYEVVSLRFLRSFACLCVLFAGLYWSFDLICCLLSCPSACRRCFPRDINWKQRMSR